MLPLPKPAVYHASKCVATYGQMPHLTPGQQQPPSSRRRPWAALLAQDFAHRVDLVLPEDAFLQLEEGLSGGGVAPPVHFRVTAALGALLDGAFYLEFVKTGERCPLVPSARARESEREKERERERCNSGGANLCRQGGDALAGYPEH